MFYLEELLFEIRINAYLTRMRLIDVYLVDLITANVRKELILPHYQYFFRELGYHLQLSEIHGRV